MALKLSLGQSDRFSIKCNKNLLDKNQRLKKISEGGGVLIALKRDLFIGTSYCKICLRLWKKGLWSMEF